MASKVAKAPMKKVRRAPRTLPVSTILEHMDAQNKEGIALVTKAYKIAKKAHAGQARFSGEPYLNHCIATAKYLAKIGMAPDMVAAGLLHDTIEDTPLTLDDLRAEFNEDICSMVEGVTKLEHVRYRGLKRHAESLRKLIAATSQDVRVMIIKLADRLHNAQTLEHVAREDKRLRIAHETLEIYAPIADRLGMGLMKRELEDAVFPFAYPNEYEKVLKIFKELGGDDTRRLEKIHKSVRKKLAEYGIEKFRTEIRVKGKYSLFRKLERKSWDITRIRDIWALRIIVPKVADCYTIFGIVQSEWQPVPGRVKDYIATPKPNGYRSIHTTILVGDGNVIELQIRSEDMHREAQFGIASHFSYKDANGSPSRKQHSGMRWILQFIPDRLWFETRAEHEKPTRPRTYTGDQTPEWLKHLAHTKEDDSPDEFLRDIKADFFSHRIFIFTPRGDVIDLPIDSTPIDFAYAIHSGIGNHISGVKINGKMTSLDTPLNNGDIVEIVTSKTAQPTQKWLAMAKTTLAKRHIRSFLQQQTKVDTTP